MALPRPKKGVSCSGVPGAVPLSLLLPHRPPPPALGRPSPGGAGPQRPRLRAAELSALQRARAAGRGSLCASKGRWRTGFLAAGYCSFSLIGTESLFIRTSEIGRMRSNLGSAAEASELVHLGFCSAGPFRERLFTWGSVERPLLSGCFVL